MVQATVRKSGGLLAHVPGGAGPRYAQLSLCWAPTEAAARETVHRVWPNAAIHRSSRASRQLVTPCGPDIVEAVTSAAKQYVEAGYDHLYFHQIGPDQDGFFAFWEQELRPALRSVAALR